MHVYLLAANTTGYGNASVSLLTSGTAGSDSVGGYVLSGSDGSFSITGDYTCTTGTQVYLYGLGGNPGAGVNASAGLMAALGNCPTAGNFATATPYVVMNEVSTVAAAYAMAGFATDATHVSSSGTAQALVGIANAFATAVNLETLSTGAALATTPAGNGKVPQAEINSLADVLAACLNTDGTGSPCSTLFTATTPGGGTTPTDTATAAINIAHFPAVNVSTLYGLVGSTPPFLPTLSLVPNEWSVAVVFNTLTLHTLAMAIDGSGNIWLAGNPGMGANTTLVGLSNTGAILSGANGYTVTGYVNQIAIDPGGNIWTVGGTGPGEGVNKLSSSGVVLAENATMVNPGSLAIDGSGNVWAGNSNSSGLYKFANDGTLLSPAVGYSTGSVPYLVVLAIDASGNVWGQTNTGPLEFSNSGSLISPAGGYSASATGPVAIDASGDAWTYAGNNTLWELSSMGTLLSPSGFHTCDPTMASPYFCLGLFPGAVEPISVATDGAGNVWSPVIYYGPGMRQYANGISEVNNAGTIVSGKLGYYTSGSEGLYPSLLQADSSGNLWGASPSQLIELVGAAVPTVTPLSVAVQLGKVGARP